MTCAPHPGGGRDENPYVMPYVTMAWLPWWQAGQRMLEAMQGTDATLGQPPPRAGQVAHLEARVADGTYSADHVRRYHGHLFDPGHALHRAEEAPELSAQAVPRMAAE